MTNATESHAAPAASIASDGTIWPPPEAAEPDVVDYGTMRRELLAEKLAGAYLGPHAKSIQDMGPLTAARWLRVVDVALSELWGTPNA